ncbi:MAG TPA: adenine deaminase [Chitinophagaceae bacterium]|nr:adenine deaminase [Chitinophagaceae bacterium]
MAAFSIKANLVDIQKRAITACEVHIEKGKIKSIRPTPNEVYNDYILPGFIDAHVHIESSMLVPSEFAKLAVVHGTVATVSDPHEIANVCGLAGVEFMIANGKTVPFKFFFGAPSCVPATTFETAGASLRADEVEALLRDKDIWYLSEMMNFPGVLNGDKEALQKIKAAQNNNKPVDGHAPGLKGDAVKKYIEAGMSTDHECFTIEEALEKLDLGMKIIIREGSAAKNFEALFPLLHTHCDRVMFCSDDKHPDSLAEGHINTLCKRAVSKGIDVFNVLQAACINPVLHYNLPVGLLREGDAADFVQVKDLVNFEVISTYINGEMVAEDNKSLISTERGQLVNQFNCLPKAKIDFAVSSPVGNGINLIKLPLIEALDGQLITNKLSFSPTTKEGFIQTDIANDILKIVVVNRYQEAPVAKAFIKNFGLKKGALASSVAHDSHNIVAVGVDDESICKAVNMIIECKGGVSCVGDEDVILPLPVAGLMSLNDGYDVAKQYTSIDKAAKRLGSTLSAPFMTLSFMALLVIPHLKLSDKGLFDGDVFRIVDEIS